MTKQEIKETLEKQLQLFTECSGTDHPEGLAKVSMAMIEVVTTLLNLADMEPGNLRPETKHCVCTKCGKEWHYDTAKYCGMCGEKLKEAPAMNSLR